MKGEPKTREISRRGCSVGYQVEAALNRAFIALLDSFMEKRNVTEEETGSEWYCHGNLEAFKKVRLGNSNPAELMYSDIPRYKHGGFGQKLDGWNFMSSVTNGN